MVQPIILLILPGVSRLTILKEMLFLGPSNVAMDKSIVEQCNQWNKITRRSLVLPIQLRTKSGSMRLIPPAAVCIQENGTPSRHNSNKMFHRTNRTHHQGPVQGESNSYTPTRLVPPIPMVTKCIIDGIGVMGTTVDGLDHTILE